MLDRYYIIYKMNETDKKTRTVTKEKENKMSKFMNAVKNTKVDKAPAKKKNSAPVINPSAKVKEAVDCLVQAKKDLTKAKADIALNEPGIIEAARKVQENDALNGNFRKSYEVLGNGNTVKFVSANKFSIAEGDVDDLSEVLGNKFDELIETSYTVKLKNEIFDDEAKQDELMNLLGDKFDEFFETVTHRKVVEDFDKKLFDLDEGVREDVKELAKQAKPSLR